MSANNEMLLDPIHDWDHVRGTADAEFTLVEYGDYQCPSCGELFLILKEFEKALGSRLRLVYRHYPMSGAHKQAQLAAEAAEAAGAQGSFWEMHDLLFNSQTALDRKNLIQYAEELGLDADRFKRELKAETYQDRVRQDFIAGVKNGVKGTPGLFLNGVRQQGVFNRSFLKELLGIN